MADLKGEFDLRRKRCGSLFTREGKLLLAALVAALLVSVVLYQFS